MAYTVGIAIALLAFQACPAAAPALQWFNVFMIGFFLYGPQMLIGRVSQMAFLVSRNQP